MAFLLVILLNYIDEAVDRNEHCDRLVCPIRNKMKIVIDSGVNMKYWRNERITLLDKYFIRIESRSGALIL